MSLLENVLNEADFHAQTLVSIASYLENNYGKEAVNQFKEHWFKEVFYNPWKELGASNPKNIKTFASLLEKGCKGTHEWVREIDEPNRVKYRFVKCIWAEIFHELGRPDIGKWFCESDYVLCEAFDKDMKFKRTKTLMDKDDYCDHEFLMEE